MRASLLRLPDDCSTNSTDSSSLATNPSLLDASWWEPPVRECDHEYQGDYDLDSPPFIITCVLRNDISSSSSSSSCNDYCVKAFDDQDVVNEVKHPVKESSQAKTSGKPSFTDPVKNPASRLGDGDDEVSHVSSFLKDRRDIFTSNLEEIAGRFSNLVKGSNHHYVDGKQFPKQIIIQTKNGRDNVLPSLERHPLPSYDASASVTETSYSSGFSRDDLESLAIRRVDSNDSSEGFLVASPTSSTSSSTSDDGNDHHRTHTAKETNRLRTFCHNRMRIFHSNLQVISEGRPLEVLETFKDQLSLSGVAC